MLPAWGHWGEFCFLVLKSLSTIRLCWTCTLTHPDVKNVNYFMASSLSKQNEPDPELAPRMKYEWVRCAHFLVHGGQCSSKKTSIFETIGNTLWVDFFFRPESFSSLSPHRAPSIIAVQYNETFVSYSLPLFFFTFFTFDNGVIESGGVGFAF